jgi:hypothetical protein
MRSPGRARWYVAVGTLVLGPALSFLLVVSGIDSDHFFSAVVIAPVCIILSAVCSSSVVFAALTAAVLYGVIPAACAVAGKRWPADDLEYGIIGAGLVGAVVTAALARWVRRRRQALPAREAAGPEPGPMPVFRAGGERFLKWLPWVTALICGGVGAISSGGKEGAFVAGASAAGGYIVGAVIQALVRRAREGAAREAMPKDAESLHKEWERYKDQMSGR